MEYYSARIRNKLLTHTTAYMNFKGIMLMKTTNPKRLYTVSFHVHDIPFLKYQNCRNGELISGLVVARGNRGG